MVAMRWKWQPFWQTMAWPVSVLLVANRKKQSEEAILARKKAVKSPVHWEDALSLKTTLESIRSKKWALVVDGMFGIGLKEALTGNRQKLVEIVNTFKCPILALDVPSGLNANTGNIVGKDEIAVHATDTITFIADKPGLHTRKGRDCAGKVHVVTLDVERKYFPETKCWLNSPDLFESCLKPRPEDSHKGSNGRIAIVGGAQGMSGCAGTRRKGCSLFRCRIVLRHLPEKPASLRPGFP